MSKTIEEIAESKYPITEMDYKSLFMYSTDEVRKYQRKAYVEGARDREQELEHSYSLSMQGLMEEYDDKFIETANENYSRGYDRAVELARNILVYVLDADALKGFEMEMEGQKYEE